MPELISLRPMLYRHRALRPGVPFTVPTAIEADLLKKAHCARDPKAADFDPDFEMAEADGSDKPARPKLKLKPPRYQRRDMRADD